MKAKWLWTTWAYLALVSVIALEVMFLVFLAVFIVPKFWQLRSQEMINPAVFNEPELSWVPEMLDGVHHLAQGTYAMMIAVSAASAWGLFEWRVRSENKSFMRFSALATAAVGLTLVIMLTTGGMVVTFCQGSPQVGRLVRPWAVEQIGNAETATQALEQALPKKDWDAMELNSIRASFALRSLSSAAPAIPSLQGSPRPTVSDLRLAVSSASQSMAEAHQGILAKDAPSVEASMQKFRKAFEPLREAAKRPVR